MTLTQTNRLHVAAACGGALAALGLLVSGCGGGGGSKPQVANIATGSTTTGAANPSAAPSNESGGGAPSSARNSFTLGVGGARARQLSACMRSHGVSNFPDPNAQGQITGNFDPNTPQFQHAAQACFKDLPQGGTPSPAEEAQARRQALAFSACMRAHGLPNFPDPQFPSGGGVSIRINPSSGVDPRSPQFQAARKACGSLLPGKPGP
jgi:hypothetical protein